MASAAATIFTLTFYAFMTSDILCDGSKNDLQFDRAFQDSNIEAGSLALTHVPDSVKFRATAGSIQLHDVPQVILLAMGFSSLQDIEWKGLLASKSIFKRPKANILFIVEGLNQGAVLPLFSKTLSYPITKGETEPNLDIGRISPFHNFISHVTSIAEEKPLVISLARKTQIAESLSDRGPKSHIISWDEEENAFIDSNSGNEIKLSKMEILKNFESADFGKDVHYQKDDNSFLFSSEGMAEAVFDMEKTEDFLFFAELEMIMKVYEKSRDFSILAKTSSPDFLTFYISSLKGLSQEYGNNSHQLIAAVTILDRFLSQVSNLFSEMYERQALIEVVAFRADTIVKTERISSEVRDLYNHVKQHLQSSSVENFNKNLPTLHLRDDLDSQKVDEICESVRSRLFSLNSNIKVNCGIPNGINHQRHKRETTNEDTEKSGVTEGISCKNPYNLASVNDKYDDLFPPIFNITLWLMILLGLALYATSLVLWYMDPGRDSIIYRVTSQHIKSE